MLKQTAAEARKDPELEAQFQFGWLEGNQLVNGIVMGTLPVPSEFFLTSYFLTKIRFLFLIGSKQ